MLIVSKLFNDSKLCQYLVSVVSTSTSWSTKYPFTKCRCVCLLSYHTSVQNFNFNNIIGSSNICHVAKLYTCWSESMPHYFQKNTSYLFPFTSINNRSVLNNLSYILFNSVGLQWQYFLCCILLITLIILNFNSRRLNHEHFPYYIFSLLYVQQLWLPYLHGNTNCFWYEVSGIQECCAQGFSCKVSLIWYS